MHCLIVLTRISVVGCRRSPDIARGEEVLSLLKLHFYLVNATRLPPALPIETLSRPKLQYIGQSILNRFKKYETAAFRPTTPGPSPGIGNHQSPPTLELKG